VLTALQGGSLLHLRGNVQGFTHASSKFKFLRFIVGRHDLPFYEHDEALLQKSFLDAFLKGQDPSGWTRGDVQPISMVLREGNVGFNDMTREKGLQRREETAWPLPQTQYTKYYLNMDKSLTPERPEGEAKKEGALYWLAMAMAPRSKRPPAARGPPPVREFSKQSSLGMLKFTTPPFVDRTEFTGHVTAHLNVRIPKRDKQTPSDIDLFVTIRHLDEQGKEIYYTGTVGDPVPVTKGWLRCSLRKIDESHPHHRDYLPHRNYFSTDVQPLEVGETYPVDIEIWPTNVVVSSGNRLVFEIAGADTQGSGVFTHEDPVDRPEGVFKGLNELVFAENMDNYVTLPLIPSA
jgi:predicted acyl esterase